MHPNPIYRTLGDAVNLEFARKRGFGTLSINGAGGGAGGPLISHVPFVISPDGKTLSGHLVRSNPILRALGAPQKAVVAVSGPDSYISPDWYDVDDQVPTWNYIAVHLRGDLQQVPASGLRAHLETLAATFEARLLPKPIWTTDKMSPDVLGRMMRMIVPVKMDIGQIDGTWKLNQNKDDSVRRAAANHVKSDGLGHEVAELAALMQNPVG